MHHLVEQVFPTPFLRVNLKDKITSNCEKIINEWRTQPITEDNFGRNTSGNWISKNFQIIKNTELEPVIQPYIDFFAEEIRGETARQTIVGSWLNVNPTGYGHHKHRHSNSKISGIFYISTNENSGNFNLYRYLEHKQEVYDDIVKFNSFNYEFMYYIPKNYDLFLFNSYMYHSVDENKSDQPRISLAFNTFYADPIGKMAHYLPGILNK